MKITESRLRKMIRGVIREFTSSATAAGAKKGGYQSAARKSAQTDYDTKSADYTTKKADYDTKKAAADAFDTNKKYRQAARGGGYNYRATGGRGWSANPDWSSKDLARGVALRARDSAETAKTKSKSTLDTRKAADLEKTVPKQKPPRGGGAGFGKGKSAGKGKGKGKGKKKK